MVCMMTHVIFQVIDIKGYVLKLDFSFFSWYTLEAILGKECWICAYLKALVEQIASGIWRQGKKMG